MDKHFVRYGEKLNELVARATRLIEVVELEIDANQADPSLRLKLDILQQQLGSMRSGLKRLAENDVVH